MFDEAPCPLLPSIAQSGGEALRRGTEIVVIDRAVSDWQSLRDGLVPGAETVLIDNEGDGIGQLVQALEGRHDIGAIHVLSHGIPGGVVLGKTVLNAEALTSRRADLDAIAANLASDADILLYSCETAHNGEAFLAGLSQLTGANVAASSHLVGAASRGGSWELDYCPAAISTRPALTPAAMAAYAHTLTPVSAPTLSSAVGYIGESSFTMYFDVALDAANPPPINRFAVQVNGTGVTVSGVSINSASHSITLTINNTYLTAGDIVEFVYTDPTVGNDVNAIQDTNGQDTANFSSSLVVSGGRPGPSAPPMPTLAPSSDTGVSASDHITNVTTPTFTGTADVGSTVKLYDTNGTTLLGTAVATNGAWSITATTLSNGLHAVKVTQTDPSNNTSPLSSSVTVTVDTTAPSMPGITTASITNNVAPRIQGTSEANATVVLAVGGATYVTTSSPGGMWSVDLATLTPASGTLTLATNGANAVSVTATDAAGNASTAATQTLTIDTTAPVLTAALASDTGSSATDRLTQIPGLTGTAEANSTVTVREGATVLGTTSTDAQGRWSFTPSGLADGSHSLTLRETDTAGNTGSTTLAFTLDTTAPVVTASLSSDTGASATDGITSIPGLTGTAEANSVVTVREGASMLGTTSTDAQGRWSFTPSGLADGSHSLTLRETDTAGNTGSTTLAFTLDTAAPVVTASLVSDTGTSATDGITRSIGMAGTAEANSTVTVRNGTAVLGTTTANAQGSWGFLPTGLADGAYTLTASQTDAAGNTGSATLAFTLDTIAPVVTASLSSDTGASATDGITGTPALTGTAEANSTVTVREGASVLGTTSTDAQGRWSFTPTGLADGSHSLTLRETDTAGNTGSTTLAFTLDTVAPVVTASLVSDTGTSATDGITRSIGMAGTAEANSTVTVRNGTAVLGTTTANAQGSWGFLPTGLADGAYTLTASQTDAAGNTGSATLAFTQDTIAPAVTATLALDSGASATDGITGTPALTGTAEANSTVTVREETTVLGTTTADAQGRWSFTPTGLADGSHSLTLRETDTAGNTGSTTLAFTLDTTAPVVTASLSSDTGASATDGITSIPGLTGTAEANSVVTVREGASMLGTTSTDAQGRWSFTPSGLADGSHSLTLRETDTAGNTGSTTLAFTLDTVAPVVTASLVSDTGTSATDGITRSIGMAGTAEANSTVTVRNGTAVLGTTTANAQGSWGFLPTGLADGAYTLTASQTDAAGNTGSATLAFTRDTIAPVVTATLASDTGASATDGITGTPALTGTAEANSTVTVREGASVLGTTSTDAQGRWSFTPTGLADGSHSLTLRETDTAGNTGSTTLAFTLDTAAPVVTASLVSDTGTSITDGITQYPTLSGMGEAYSVVTVRNGTAVLGTTSTDAQGRWGFQPTGLADGTYTLTASQTDAAGNTGSITLAFTLDTTAPAVTVSLSSDTGASATDGMTNIPVLTGTAEASSVVTVREGTTVLGTTSTDAQGRWSFTPSGLADGSHSLTARETDTAGNTGSTTLAFTLDTAAPAVTATLAHDTGASAADGITRNAGLTGTAEANGIVTIAGGGTVLGTATADAQGSWSFAPGGLAEGSHTLTASQTDTAGNTGSTTLAFTLDTVAPATAFSLSNDAGSSATDHVTNDPTLIGTVEANTAVTVTEGSTVLMATRFSAGGRPSFTPGLPDGGHTLTVTQTDIAGNTGSATLAFTLDKAAPALTAALSNDTGLSATDGVTSNAGLTGTAEANGIVTIADGGTVLGTATADAQGSWSFMPAGVADGAHSLTASQTDGAGNTGTAALGFTLDTTAPAVVAALASDTGVSATDRITSDPTLTGTAEANGTVTVRNGSAVLGTATADAQGSWSFRPAGLADGAYSLTASQTDAAGNTGAATLAFTLDTTAPTVAAPAVVVTPPVETTPAVETVPAIETAPPVETPLPVVTVPQVETAPPVVAAPPVTHTPDGSVHPFADLVVSNPDASEQVTVAARVLPATAGSYGNLGGGSVSADGLTYTVSGTAAAVNAALAAVLFTPAAGQAAPTSHSASVSDLAGTSTLANMGSSSSQLQASHAGDVVTAGSGADTLVAAASGTRLVGGAGAGMLVGNASGSSTLVGGAGSATFFAQGGPTRIEGGSGHDTVSAPTGDVTVVSGAGGSVIGLGAGTAVVNGQGPDTIMGGAGLSTIGSAAGSLVTLGTGSAVVSAAAGGTVVGGAGTDTVGVRGDSVLFFAGSGRSLFIGGTGASTVAAGTGSQTVFGAVGGGVFAGGSGGGNLIIAGQQATTIVGGGDGDLLFAQGSAGDMLVAGAGNETLQGVGSSGNDVFFGGTGNTLIGLGSGQDTVVAGTGSATVVAGTGRDLFAFVNGRAGGTESIVGFKTGTDQLSLQGYADGEIGRALASARTDPGSTTQAASTTITLSDNTRISFLGMATMDARVFG